MKPDVKSRQDIRSAAIVQSFWLILACCGLFALTAYASDPSWWSTPGPNGAPSAIVPEQVVTNNGVVTTNYITNDYAVITQGQLKQFTVRAVDYLNANLTDGAGTNLNSMVSNWAADYATNGYATNPANPTRPYEPSDFQVENVGQVKYIGNLVWSQLVAAGYTNAAPSWLEQDTNTDHAVANVGQLKEVFNFDLSAWQPAPIPQITSPATVTASVGVQFSYTITASNNPTSYGASNLPSWLSLNGYTISGTPPSTAAGICSVTLTATNSAGTGTGVVVFNIVQSTSAPVINSPTVAVATAGSSFAYQITASNNPTQFGANIPSSLSGQLSFNANTGVISGTPNTTGTFTISLSATNGAGTGASTLTLAVNPSGGQSTGPLPVIISSPTATGMAGQSFSYQIAASNAPTSFGTSGLPAGLNINTSTGLISGTPASGGTSNVIISATNSYGTTSALLNLTISAITSPLTATTTVGAPFTYTITSTITPTNSYPVVYTVGTLPAGLTFDGTNIISGAATAPGFSTVLITGTNSATSPGLAAEGNLVIMVNGAANGSPVITSATNDTARAGQSYSYTITAQNSPLSLNATGPNGGALPAGLAFDSNSGTISGTPTATGTYTIDLTATNAQGSGIATLTLTVANAVTGVAPAPVLTSSNVAYATAGIAFSYTPVVNNGTASFNITGLPSGFTYSTTTGVITGTPTLSEVGTDNVTINATNSLGMTTMPLVLVIQGTTAITATVALQDGVSPSANYQTISAGIATDTTNSAIATQTAGGLFVGRTSPTQINRTLLGFDLSPLPPGVTITSAELILNTEPTGSTSSGTYTLELDQPGPFSPSTACWTNNNTYTTNTDGSAYVLSSISASIPATAATPETWPSSANFVSVIQNAYNSRSPVYLMVRAPGIESGSTVNDFYFDNEDMPTDSGDPPILLLTYQSASPPAIITPPPQTIPINLSGGYSPFNYRIAASDTNANTTFSATGLPGGLSINSATGLISGTPNSSDFGVYTVTVTVSTPVTGAGTTLSGTATFTIAVGSAPVITSSTAPVGASTNAPFLYQITGTNNPTGFSASNLPPGLKLDSTSGIISGTPTVAESAEVTIGAYNALGSAPSKQFLITFAPVIDPPSGTITGNADLPFSYHIQGEDGAVGYGLSSSLPAALSFDSTDGIITGAGANSVPTSIGTYQVSVYATNYPGEQGPSTDLPISIAGTPVLSVSNQTICCSTETSYSSVDVNAVGQITYNPPVGNAVSQGPGISSCTIYSGSLPAELSMDDTNNDAGSAGSITGTLTDGSSSGVTTSATIRVVDTLGNSATPTITFIVYNGPGISSPLTAQMVADATGFAYQLQTVTGTETSTAAEIPSSLTPYLTYNPATELITEINPGIGPPPGSYTIGLIAKDSSGTSTANLALTVAPSTVTSPATAIAYVGQPVQFYVTDNTATSYQAFNLPPGTASNPFTINPTTGEITGTPVAADTVPIKLMVTDQNGTETSTLLLIIEPNPSGTSASMNFQQDVSPAANYPVPSAIVETDSTNSAVANESFTTTNALTVGQATATRSSRALLDFNLSALPPNATIVSAALAVNVSAVNFPGAPLTVETHQSNGSFTSGSATWNSNGGYNSSVLESLALNPATSSFYTFPVSSALAQAVQQAYNNGAHLYLTLASPSAEQGNNPDYINFVTNASNPNQNPELMVTYTLGTSGPPVITSATTVTATVGSSINYTITASNNPQHFAATGLPSGLSVNGATGAVTGSVSTVGSTVAMVSATNSIGTGAKAVTFNIDNVTPATSLQVVANGGNNQVGLPGALLPQPLQVEAYYNGAPLPNALVTFTVPPSTGGLAATNTGNPPTSSTLTVVTNSSGIATAYFVLPQTVGNTTVVASAGTAQPVSLVETSSLDGGTSSGDSLVVLTVLSGEGQSGPARQTLPQPFVIQAANASGQPVSTPLLLTTTDCGIGSSAGGSFGSSLNVTTDGLGQATVYMQPGSGPDNEASCLATSSVPQATVYLSALTSSGSGSGSSPTAGQPEPPEVDPTIQPWNGSVQVEPTDTYTQDNGDNPPNLSNVTVFWSGNTANVAGYLVEKKVSTGNWTQVYNAPDDSTTTNYTDSGLLANEEIQYRVSPYMSNPGGGSPILADPCAPVSYQVPLIQYVNVATSSAEGGAGSNGGPIQNNNMDYLTEIIIQSNGASATTTYTPVPTYISPGQGVLEWSANYVSTTGSGPNSGPPTISYASPYTQDMCLGDVIASMPDYGPWNPIYFDWGANGTPWGPYGQWASTVSQADGGYYGVGTWPYYWLASFYGYNDGMGGFGYQIQTAEYQFQFYPANNVNFQWADVYSPGIDDTPEVMQTHSYTVNSSSGSQSSIYTLNPLNYPNQFGNYFILPVSQLEVTDGNSFLDSQEKAQTGAQVYQVPVSTGESIGDALNNYSGPMASFNMTAGEFGGDWESTTGESGQETLTWSGTGANTLQVWGNYYNGSTAQWEQISNGETVLLSLSDDNEQQEPGFIGFDVIATSQAQNNDSINLTLTTSAATPGGGQEQLGTDSSLFTYNPVQPDFSMPIDEASGARYRKIALNGQPMPDEKPQQSAESDQEKEETYVDALTLGLHHSTTDAYMPVSGSDFSLSARRDFRSQVWNNRSGLRPHEQPDLPFGMGWSSNLAPNIKFSYNNDPSSTTPPEAVVTDETGAVHTFFIWYDTNGTPQFFPMPTAKNEAQVPNLESLTANASTYVFTRKYGATLTYQITPLVQPIENDRLTGSQYTTTYQYAQLVKAVDRLGNTINYQYQGASSNTNLIPSTITVANQPGLKLSIEQEPVSSLISTTNTQSVVTAIWDANGNETQYGYQPA
ncbi:MAG TPA: putative Ig domain-containing protein, partial [Candidatus Methylacidiphilales bacterium]|nr:putative Ig domain-containing protein [Candidatus Methylacidiphilales bacterium]